MDPFILCICPTYKRPAFLANVVACYLQQRHPAQRRHLLICDDALQFSPQAPAEPADAWSLFTSPTRYPTLPDKFNAIVDNACSELGLKPDIIVIWEDDDIYLPWHLTSIAGSWRDGGEHFTQSQIWSTYKEPRGAAHLGKPGSLFHGSWAYTADLFARVGKYPIVNRLDFDQRMGALLRKNGKHAVVPHENPSYVYRWGGVPYHGSQQSGDRFQAFWAGLADRPSPWIGKLVPAFDDETRTLFKKLAQIEV